MLNKNDPLIAAVQKVMQTNQAERDAVATVNEKFGITDRKALPRERQHEWDSAYQSLLNESDDMGPVKKKESAKMYKHKTSGKEIKSVKHPGNDWELMKEALHPNQQKLDVHEPEKDELTKKDFEKLRAMGEEKKMKDDPCWDTHEMVGMKKGKGGKSVPNCVPVKEEGDPSKAIRGDVVTGGSSVTTTPKPTPKPAIGEPDQKALTNKIKSIMEKWNENQRNKQKDIADAIARKNPNMSDKQKFRIAGGAVNKMKKKLEEAGPNPDVVKKQQADAAAATSRNPSDQPGILDKIKTNIGMGSSASQIKPSGMSGNYPRSAQTTKTMGQVTKDAGEKAVERIKASRTASAGGARPAVVAKNSYTGAQASTGNQVGGARPSVVAKNSPSQKSYNSGAGAMENPTQRPYDAKTSPSKAPIPKAKPSVPGKKVVPAAAAQKKPAYSAMQRRQARTQLDKGAVGPEARKLQKIAGGGVTTGKTIFQKARAKVKRPIGMGREK